MPELPEVEHTAQSLREWLSGKTIVRVCGAGCRIFRGGSLRNFKKMLPGRRLLHIDRRGKYLLLQFDGDIALTSHLGMTGRWLLRTAAPGRRRTVPKHSRARLVLDDGGAVHYCDARMFGRIAIVSGSPLDLPEIRALGPDPLVDGIDPATLYAALQQSTRPVKVSLMDQRLIAGVGNIYATEALFRAGIHPARPARAISSDEARCIAEGILASMNESLASMEKGKVTYLSDGGVENRFSIYDRYETPCPRCNSILERMTLGGRTSTYCPRCQR